jgi:microcystin-dependent protein
MSGTPVVVTELQWRRSVEKRIGWLERRPGTGARGDRIVGEVIAYAGPVSPPPTGWLVCLGQFVLIADYPDLADLLGSTYLGGASPIAGQFRLPDGRDRVVMGPNTYPRGTYGGEWTHVLTVAEMPAHTHQIGTSLWTPVGGSGGNVASDSATFTTAVKATEPRGGNTAHSLVQPFVAMNYLIRT